MQCKDVKEGLRVRIGKLGSTEGYMVVDHHLKCRREGATGRLGWYVPGHGGDVWWVAHDDGTTGAYAYDEFDPIVEEKTVDKDASVLRGKDAKKFLRSVETNLKKSHSKKYKRAKKVYDRATPIVRAPDALRFEFSVVKEDTYRSQSRGVNMTDDMIRVVLDMTRNEWRQMLRLRKPNTMKCGNEVQ